MPPIPFPAMKVPLMIKTANVNLNSTFRIVVMSDSQGHNNGINEKTLKTLLNTIKHSDINPKYIVFTGDLVSGSKDPAILQSQFENFKRVFTEYYAIDKLLPIAGNHDLGRHSKDDSRELLFSEIFSEFKATGFATGYNRTVYYVDIGNIRLIMLNAFHNGENNEITGHQLGWFKKVVSEPYYHKIIFVHSPPFPTGAHVDKPLNKYTYEQYKFWDIVDKNDVSLVLSGHEHNYSRRIINDCFNCSCFNFSKSICQVITGGAGGKLKNAFYDTRNVIIPPTPANHFVLLDISTNFIHASATSAEGKLIDKFSIAKNALQLTKN